MWFWSEVVNTQVTQETGLFEDEEAINWGLKVAKQRHHSCTHGKNKCKRKEQLLVYPS